MIDRIVMEGGLIRHERIETLSESPLEALSEHLIRKIATTLPVLPTNPVRYIHFDGETGRGMMLVETAPTRRHLRVQHQPEGRYPDATRQAPGEDHGVGIWTVQFPWQYFKFVFRYTEAAGALTNFTIDDVYLYWALDTLRGPAHSLLPAPVPNVDDRGRICWGNTRADATSLSARIDDYINNFTTTTFNDHLGHRTPFGTSLTEWEDNSPIANPFAWRDWPIWQAGVAHTTTPLALSTDLEPTDLPPMATLDPTYIELPTPPASFTVQRAREYLQALTPQARQRFAIAMALEEVPA